MGAEGIRAELDRLDELWTVLAAGPVTEDTVRAMQEVVARRGQLLGVDLNRPTP